MAGLPPLINVLLCTFTALLGAWTGRRAHRREALSDASHILKHSPHLWLIVTLPVLLLVYHLTFVFNPDWEWRLPYAVQFYYGPAAWAVLVGCFTYFCGFGTVVFFETRHPQRQKLGAIMVLLFVAIQQFHWRTTTRIVPAVREPRITGEGFVLQTSAETCVPAATASLLAVLGERRSEAELVGMMGTDMGGTLPSQLVFAMRRLGFREATVDVDRDGIEAIKTPAVVFLRNNSHAIALLKSTGQGDYIWDPSRGKVFAAESGLRRFLAGAHAIHFQRAGSPSQPVEPSKSRGI